MPLRSGWWCLLAVSAGILGFGVVIVIAPLGADEPLYRADGLASIGLGLFGGPPIRVFFPARDVSRRAMEG